MNTTNEGARSDKEPTAEDRFAGAYEGASIARISYEDLPKGAVNYFEMKSSQYTPPEKYAQGQFSHIARIDHPDSSVTYVAEGEQEWPNNMGVAPAVYFVDYIDDTPAGHAELCFNPKATAGTDDAAPYVGSFDTYTERDKESGGKNFQRRGLGTRRVLEMDAYAKARFGQSLDSDTHLVHDGVDADGKPTSSMRRIWERLVKEEKAEQYVRAVLKDGTALTAYRMK